MNVSVQVDLIRRALRDGCSHVSYLSGWDFSKTRGYHEKRYLDEPSCERPRVSPAFMSEKRGQIPCEDV